METSGDVELIFIPKKIRLFSGFFNLLRNLYQLKMPLSVCLIGGNISFAKTILKKKEKINKLKKKNEM